MPPITCRLAAALAALFACVPMEAGPAAGSAPAPVEPPRALAFPGAEGFGAYARGGTGGRILVVTTTEDTGREGSLRWAVSQPGPRRIEFKVGGLFTLRSALSVREPFLTLDGSAAPNGGVTLKDGALLILGTHDVIVRYLRVRPGDEALLGKGVWHGEARKGHASDAVSVKDSHDVIIDHVSASWSTDETISVTRSERVTVQACIIAEPLANPKLHVEDGREISHPFGALVEGDDVCYLKNYIAYFRIRGPQLAASHVGHRVRTAAVNNLVAFYQSSGTRVKASHTPADYIVLNNRYEHALNPKAPQIELLLERIKSQKGRQPDPSETEATTRIYIAGNLGPQRTAATQDEWVGTEADFDGQAAGRLRVAKPPFTIEPLQLLPTARVEAWVLANAGATLPARDAVDERLLRQFRQGTGGIIQSQDDVGGYAPRAEPR